MRRDELAVAPQEVADMRTRFAVLMLFAAAALAPLAISTPAASSTWVTPFAGWTQLSDKLLYPAGDSLKDAAVFGARLGRDFANGAALELGGYYSPTGEAAGLKRDVTLMGGAVSLEYSPVMWTKGALYLGAGFGASSRSADGFDNDTHATFEQALGWRGWFNEQTGYLLEARNILQLPSHTFATSNHSDQQYLFGLTWATGRKPRDSDGDGVPDRKDHCPLTPVGASVDASGCPVDSDHDGVFDGIDACPNTPAGATVDARGCPKDSDGDGVWDGIDTCPDSPKGAKVDATGCPVDTDHDGVWDGIDQCANTPAGATVDANGCPTDADGDGVYDGLDKCANTPAGAKVGPDGCPPPPSEQETQLRETGRIRLEGINFETGKAKLLPESLPILDKVGDVLRDWPILRVEIGGHTDNRGSAALNLRLSADRARAVRTYLLEHFPQIQANHLTTHGYGSSRPVAKNNSDENRAKNRRVEFVVLNRKAMQAEMNKRAQ